MPQVKPLDDPMDDLPAAVAAFEADVARVDLWVNGDALTDYTTTGGLAVPSISKVIANVDEMIAPDVAKITAGATQATNAANAAKISETNSAASAATASNAATLAQDAETAIEASAIAANDDADRAEAAANAAGSARDTAVAAQESVQTNADRASSAATNAEASATVTADMAADAGDYASAASGSAQAAATSEGNAAASAVAAGASQTASKTSETNSAASAAAAHTSETNAAASANAAQSGHVLLEQFTFPPSGVSLYTFTSISADYDDYELVLSGINFSAPNGQLWIRYGFEGGYWGVDASYSYVWNYMNDTGQQPATAQGNHAGIALCLLNGQSNTQIANNVSGKFEIFGCNDNTIVKCSKWELTAWNTAGMTRYVGAGTYYGGPGRVRGFQLLSENGAGLIVKGTARLYGMRK